jgi:RimJ/RimL family protein N-acetyltransferase
MTLTVREMAADETDLIVDYFLNSTSEHLEMLGVDPTRFPPAASWRERIRRECKLPIEQRAAVLVSWLSDELPIGFSTLDKISFGEQANMHLHVIEPDRRKRGVGTECVRRSVDLYFDRLKLKRLFCEPHATSRRTGRCRRSGSDTSRRT